MAVVAPSITATYPHQHPAKEVCFLPLMDYMLTCKEGSLGKTVSSTSSFYYDGNGSACKVEVSLGFRRLAIGKVINRTYHDCKEELHFTDTALPLSPT